MRILIVDDEQDVLDLFKDLFTKQRYHVECASSGQSALEMIKKQRPDVVLLDIKMPQMYGLQALQEIKKIDPTIHVIMLTAYGYDDKLINESIEKGASGYISKNLPLKQIINTFNTLVRTIPR
ncbi:MAG: response regulator [Candidatus Omnitrophota bacterium]